MVEKPKNKINIMRNKLLGPHFGYRIVKVKNLNVLKKDMLIQKKVDEFTTSHENVFLVETKARMGLLELVGCAGENMSTWSSNSTN